MHLHLYKSLHLNTRPSGKLIEGAFTLWHSMCSIYLQNQFLEETCTCTLLKLLENLIYKIATTLHLDISLPKNLCSEFVTYLSHLLFWLHLHHSKKNAKPKILQIQITLIFSITWDFIWWHLEKSERNSTLRNPYWIATLSYCIKCVSVINIHGLKQSLTLKPFEVNTI